MLPYFTASLLTHLSAWLSPVICCLDTFRINFHSFPVRVVNKSHFELLIHAFRLLLGEFLSAFRQMCFFFILNYLIWWVFVSEFCLCLFSVSTTCSVNLIPESRQILTLQDVLLPVPFLCLSACYLCQTPSFLVLRHCQPFPPTVHREVAIKTLLTLWLHGGFQLLFLSCSISLRDSFSPLCLHVSVSPNFFLHLWFSLYFPSDSFQASIGAFRISP